LLENKKIIMLEIQKSLSKCLKWFKLFSKV